MPWEDDVVVPDWGVQEVRRLGWVGEPDDLLCAAQVGLSLILHKFAFLNEAAGEIARHLEDGDWTFLHVTSDTHTDARFKMCVELISLHQVEGYGAVCKQHLSCLGIDVGGISLEATHAHQYLSYLHGEHGRHITFAACHDAFCIQFCQRQATRIVNGTKQVEAAQCEALQAVPLDDRL